jgi:hypothetical protein
MGTNTSNDSVKKNFFDRQSSQDKRAEQSASMPRKRSEEYFDLHCRVNSDTPLIDDAWLYHWTGHPPEALQRHKTVFRQCTPADISRNGWTVLCPAVKEMGKIFGVQKPEAKHDSAPGAERRSAIIEWLTLNNYHAHSCLMGIYGDEYVVAAAPLSCAIESFVPFSTYKLLHENKIWKNLKYRASYRHFLATFDIGYSFHMGQQNLLCDVTYGIHVSVHGNGHLWAVINVDGTCIPAPDLIPLVPDLTDLPTKIEQINTRCHLFVRRLGAAWLRNCDRDHVFNMIRRMTRDTRVPWYAIDSLRNDPRLDRCRNELDVLRAVMRSINIRPADEQILKFVSLSQQFNIGEKRCH